MGILDGNTYKKWHGIYDRSSNEKSRTFKILERIFKKMPSRNSFLDVGSGEGDLTLRIKPFFGATVALDPNKYVDKVFKEHDIEFINKSFEDAYFGDRKFDFILCSHVFWLIKKDKQTSFIEKMRSLLSENGQMAIIMMAPINKCHEFHEKFFYNYDTTSYEILKIFHSLGLPATVFPVDVKFETDNFDDFLSICKLFTLQSWLHPVNISDEKVRKELGDISKYTEEKIKGIKEYINSFCKSGNKTYSMEMSINILIVKNTE